MLFERRYPSARASRSNYDVTAHGQRFLMVKDQDLAGRLRGSLSGGEVTVVADVSRRGDLTPSRENAKMAEDAQVLAARGERVT